ncbi:hypothetical protein C8J56DRAFT_434718 [Mycena floridula]|nr:hypothetical protein C8J56DRAFT_434718 [Mycena floridula]
MSRRGVAMSKLSVIEILDGGLTSVRGAQQVISKITSRRTVTKLILGHNELGDDGCVVLTRFLSSSIGSRISLVEISLNANKIGNVGLLAIAEYLQGNQSLREIYLQNNNFTADPSASLTLAQAVNSSNLRVLALTTNRALSDAFVEYFLPALASPSLRELHLSALNLTPKSAEYIAQYVSSSRCRLHTLKCNGNFLGLPGVNSIVQAVEKANYALKSIELHSNNLADDPNGSGSDWKETQARIALCIARNRHIEKQIQTEAFILLKYSRALLHASDKGQTDSTRTGSYFPFALLPIELQQEILSFLAPMLSPSQRISIFTYASSSETLPRLIWPFRRDKCVADPLSLGFVNASSTTGCGGGICLGSRNSLVCHLDQHWLESMGCV